MDDKGSGLGSILSGIGSILLGIAAIVGGCAAKEAVTKINLSNTNNNSVAVNIGLACEQIQKLKSSAGNPDTLNSLIQTLPEVPEPGGTGLIIEGKYKDDLYKSLRNTNSPEKAEATIQKYFEKSLSSFGGKVRFADGENDKQ